MRRGYLPIGRYPSSTFSFPLFQMSTVLPKGRIMNKLLLVCGSLLLLLSATMPAADELLYFGKPASYWLDKVASETRDERAEAIQALASGTFPDRVVVPGLIVALGDKDQGLRDQAVEALRSIGAAAVSALTRTLEDNNRDAEVRAWAARTLGRMGPAAQAAAGSLQKALKAKASSKIRVAAASALGNLRVTPTESVRALKDALDEDDAWDVHPAVVTALGKFGRDAREAVPTLARALDSEQLAARIPAAEALGKIGPDAKAASPSLRKVLKHENDNLRLTAAMALWKVEESAQEVLPILMEALRSNRDDVRRFATVGLGLIGPEAAPAIPELTKGLEDQNGLVRQDTVKALGRMGPKARSAVPALGKRLSDRSEQVRLQTAAALAQLGPEAAEAVPQLGRALATDEKKEIRQRAAEALEGIGPASRGAMSDLTWGLKDPDNLVRTAVLRALWKLGPSAAPAVPGLVETLQDEEFHVRWTATQVLASIGADAVPDLRRALTGSASDWVRAGAAQALGRMGQENQASLPDELASLSDHDKGVRLASATAVGKIVFGINDRHYRKELRQAFPQLETIRTDVDETGKIAFDRDVLGTVRGVLDRWDMEDATKRWVGIALGSSVLLAVVLALVASVRFRRWLLVRSGRRWHFVTERCEHKVVVYHLPKDPQLRLAIDDGGDGFPLAPAFQPTLDSPELRELQRRFAGERVRVEVIEPQFRKPWAQAIGGPLRRWKEVAIGGQICLEQELLNVPRPSLKRITFAGLGCDKPPCRPDLPTLKPEKVPRWASRSFRLKCRLGCLPHPAGEVDLVAERFALWGASILPQPAEARTEAKVAHLQDALKNADIVHVSAHASPEGIFLHDAFMGVTHLQGLLQHLRCRVLVLSACDVGDLGEHQSFVLPLVRRGVHVLAATRRLNVNLTLTFFRAFYAELLPTREATGVQLARAMRAGVAACFPSDTAWLRNSMWRDAINSFILYGDPTLQLQL